LKKSFALQVENKKPERQLESVKNEIRKYMKRERKKKLPEDAVYWDFECRFGQSEEDAATVTASELIAALDKGFAAGWKACYVEIIAKASMKKAEASEDEAAE